MFLPLLLVCFLIDFIWTAQKTKRVNLVFFEALGAEAGSALVLGRRLS
jgi:hypothetical protein